MGGTRTNNYMKRQDFDGLVLLHFSSLLNYVEEEGEAIRGTT